MPGTGGLGTAAPALYSRSPASRATGLAPASSPARSVLLPCCAQRPGTKAALDQTTHDTFATNLRTDGRPRHTLLVRAFHLTLRKPRAPRGAAGARGASTSACAVPLPGGPGTLSRVQEASLNPHSLGGLRSGSPQHLCSPPPRHLPCYLKLRLPKCPTRRRTGWVNRRPSIQWKTVQKTTERLSGGAASLKGELGGNRCAHTLARGAWHVLGADTGTHPPGCCWGGRDLFTVDVPSRDFWICTT